MIQQQAQFISQLLQRQKGNQDKCQTLQTTQWEIQGNDNKVTLAMGGCCLLPEQAQQEGGHKEGRIGSHPDAKSQGNGKPTQFPPR